MRQRRFNFNPETLTYDKVEWTTKRLFLIAIFIVFSLGGIVLSILGYSNGIFFTKSEQRLIAEKQAYKYHLEILQSKVENLEGDLALLKEKDNELYKEIFGVEPLPEEIEKAGTGGSNPYQTVKQKDIKKAYEKIDAVIARIKVRQKSFDDLVLLAKKKSNKIAHIPSIQPVSNKNLKRVASGFGYRIDPYYRTRKFHQGMDFSARQGTKVYATADGVVKETRYSKRGYGNKIIIHHGYGFTTLYAHLYKIKVRKGQKVKRGELIGLVGSTGKSTGPHLHYEVRLNNKAQNPANYYFNDLSAEEYDEILKLSDHPNITFD
ncbi:MAG: peptidoglycan DD-metalloendopeptidase family protein [Bacteroidota bacterium]|nr:peptidoglycan DD-metalloendopeptidase family protein [Bacteroidota bacterium]